MSSIKDLLIEAKDAVVANPKKSALVAAGVGVGVLALPAGAVGAAAAAVGTAVMSVPGLITALLVAHPAVVGAGAVVGGVVAANKAAKKEDK